MQFSHGSIAGHDERISCFYYDHHEIYECAAE
jgi:hypothetical protein